MDELRKVLEKRRKMLEKKEDAITKNATDELEEEELEEEYPDATNLYVD